jgi:hypothetical protein
MPLINKYLDLEIPYENKQASFDLAQKYFKKRHI